MKAFSKDRPTFFHTIFECTPNVLLTDKAWHFVGKPMHSHKRDLYSVKVGLGLNQTNDPFTSLGLQNVTLLWVNYLRHLTCNLVISFYFSIFISRISNLHSLIKLSNIPHRVNRLSHPVSGGVWMWEVATGGEQTICQPQGHHWSHRHGVVVPPYTSYGGCHVSPYSKDCRKIPEIVHFTDKTWQKWYRAVTFYFLVAKY